MPRERLERAAACMRTPLLLLCCMVWLCQADSRAAQHHACPCMVARRRLLKQRARRVRGARGGGSIACCQLSAEDAAAMSIKGPVMDVRATLGSCTTSSLLPHPVCDQSTAPHPGCLPLPGTVVEQGHRVAQRWLHPLLAAGERDP